jgi:predicted nucleic acid-binding protein
LIFIDTNILIDIATGNPDWADWSRHAIASARARGPLLINAIVYAEFAIGFEAQSDCDAEIEKFELTLADMPKSAAFRASPSLLRQPARPADLRHAEVDGPPRRIGEVAF